MSHPRTDNVLATASLILSLGLSLAWIGGWLFGGGNWLLHVGLPLVSLTAIGALALLLGRNWQRERRLAQQHFEALCELDPETMSADVRNLGLPPLPEGTPWSSLAEQLHETILRLCQRVQDVEHARTALEVRYLRALSQTHRIQNILSAIADPILAIDDYDEIVLANPSAEELLHFDATAESRALSQLVRCQKLVQLLTATRQRQAAGRRTDDIEIADDQGRVHWYRATALKLADSDDGTLSRNVGVVAVLRDIGDQKLLQKQNAEFVSSVSHEMKTPLAGIKAYVELLADGDAEDDATRGEFLDVINSQADRLQRLVENLLNLARIEAGVVQVSKRPRSLNELLEEALRVVGPSAEAKEIQLESELSPMYLGVLADRDMLLQAAINLLSNAIKYTPRGGRVALRSRLVGEQVRFEVQDTGVGLNDEDREKVFEKFYRVKKDRDMAPGTGLGLPLAKHIVEDVHGGRLTVESAPGQGSTFAVTLPSAGQMRGDG